MVENVGLNIKLGMMKYILDRGESCILSVARVELEWGGYFQRGLLRNLVEYHTVNRRKSSRISFLIPVLKNGAGPI